MEGKYLIVLFKNKKKRKIIKSYFRESVAKKKFKDLLNDNNVKFEKTIENATPVNYEIGLLTKNSKIQKSIFITDDLGRNTSAVLEDSEYVFLDLKRFKIEETIFDWQTKNKITLGELIDTYCSGTDLKNIFTLHNKICIQLDMDVSVFSLKDSDESDRLLDVIQNHFIENNRLDAIFVKDVSSAQRKWLYDLLVGKGFDKKRLYRLKTTFSKR